MKSLLLILSLTIFSLAAVSQDIVLVDPIFEESVSTGNVVKTVLQIRNDSDHPIRLGVQLNDSYHKGNQISSICIGNECFTDFDALEITTLNPGEVLNDIQIRFNAGYDELTRELSLTLYDIEKPSSRLTERFRYHIKNNFPNGVLFANDALQISKVYPNPVSTAASIDYAFNDQLTPATVTIHNILGDRVLELKLDQSESNLKIPVERLPNGIYFYTLQLNGRGVTTKKFVIKK
ncbi:MAG: T9SS type A sorting domain-containing protein [Bacteroidota bacterium]